MAFLDGHYSILSYFNFWKSILYRSLCYTTLNTVPYIPPFLLFEERFLRPIFFTPTAYHFPLSPDFFSPQVDGGESAVGWLEPENWIYTRVGRNGGGNGGNPHGLNYDPSIRFLYPI